MQIVGVIVNYHIAYTKEVLVSAQGVHDRKEASKLIGHKAAYEDPRGKIYIGRVSGIHGMSGILKVKFKNPLPSSSLAQKITIL